MASCDDYTVGWVCALPVEAAAAKALFDRIHDDLPVELTVHNANIYVLGSVDDHNVVLAYPRPDAHEPVSVADVVAQLYATFRSVRLSLLVGIGGGVPNTKEDIRLGDVVVSKRIAGRPGLIQYENHSVIGQRLDRISSLLLTATGKAETAEIFDESQVSLYLSRIAKDDPVTFRHPGAEQDILFDTNYEHAPIKPKITKCDQCDSNKICYRPARETPNPKIHYGLVASSHQPMCHSRTRDKLAREQGVLCFDTEATGLTDVAQCLVIRGICDYADSHSSKLWHGYAAAAAAAYARELLSFIPATPKPMPLAENTYAVAAPILDALLLTRPEVDRASLIALKGRRVDGTCEWLVQHSSYQNWLVNADSPLLWVSGGPGKGKTMLAIFITEMLQPAADSNDDVLLYYFCSNRDKNRNTALAIMRGILHQWLNLHPHLAKHVKSSFEGTETTKYTVSNFMSLWRIFLNMLHQSGSSKVVCVLDGLDECEKGSLKQLLDALGNYLSGSGDISRSRLKLILLSRPRPLILHRKLRQYQQVQLDDADIEVSNDVEKYISAKVSELASEQDLSSENISQVREKLLAGADGTFLWVGFVANELQGRDWHTINEILRTVPKGLGGIYQRLLQQVDDKEKLVPILQWIVLAARPLTLAELTEAAGTEASNGLQPIHATKHLLVSCGLLVKMEGDVVNLVHESAKEFFQSDQVKIEGINMFHMSKDTHCALMRICLTLIEQNYGGSQSFSKKCRENSLLAYANLYWPEHFRHAIDVVDMASELSRPFFQVESPIRDAWWKFYWEQEKNGGAPPSFTLLHLAAYLGNLSWAQVLLNKRARLISRKDTYGRTPLPWAVNRGHREMAALLLARGASVNAKDRSDLTALHIAITGEHKDIVSLLLEHKASLEVKANAGDTPLMRAIQANSKDIVELLLEHGASMDTLPIAPGIAPLKRSTEPLEERAKELLGLREQLFAVRYKEASKRVDLVMKAGSLSFRFPFVLRLLTLYLKFVAVGRWESLSVLQELVKDNKTVELRSWAQAYRKFFVQLIAARNPKTLAAMTSLPTQILQVVSTADLKALLVIAVLVGSETKLEAVRHEWREGDAITARAFSHWASIAYRRDAEEFLHYGVREFLADFNDSIRSGNKSENVARTMVLFTAHFAMLENNDPRPIEYFSSLIAEFYEGYIGGRYEIQLFNDANRACANELAAISKDQDSHRLRLFLTSILQFSQRSREKGQDRFLNMVSASCLILCQSDANVHQWLISEGIPERMIVLISEHQGSFQKRAYKALVECLIIGKQYGFAPSTTLKRKLNQDLNLLAEFIP